MSKASNPFHTISRIKHSQSFPKPTLSIAKSALATPFLDWLNNPSAQPCFVHHYDKLATCCCGASGCQSRRDDSRMRNGWRAVLFGNALPCGDGFDSQSTPSLLHDAGRFDEARSPAADREELTSVSDEACSEERIRRYDCVRAFHRTQPPFIDAPIFPQTSDEYIWAYRAKAIPVEMYEKTVNSGFFCFVYFRFANSELRVRVPSWKWNSNKIYSNFTVILIRLSEKVDSNTQLTMEWNWI